VVVTRSVIYSCTALAGMVSRRSFKTNVLQAPPTTSSSPAAPAPAPAAAPAGDDAFDLFTSRRHTTLIPVPLTLPWRRRLGLFLGVFVMFLLAGSREPPWSDAKQVHGVAEAIAERGTVALPIGIPHAGKFYGTHPLLPSLVHVPGAWLHHKIATKWPSARVRSKAFTSHLGSAFVGALAVLLFVQLCLEFGASAGVAALGGLTLAFGTMLAIYARVAWTEIVQVACFLGFFRAVLRTAATPTRAIAIALGVWAGALVNSKLVFLTCLPGAAAFVGFRLWRQHGRATVARTAGWVALGGLPGVAMLLGYNLVRGGIFNAGYSVGGEGAGRAFGESLFFGLHGLFFSLGKSVFLYNPPLIIAALAIPFVLRQGDVRFGRDWLWATLLTAVPPLLVYARLVFWSGDWAWGPRYLLYLVPLMLLPGVLALQLMTDRGRMRTRLALTAAGLTLAAGLFVQVVGGLFYWDHFIRLTQAGQQHWLGKPNRSGAVSATRNDGHCDPCFEDFLTFNHLPAFQPIEGHLWLARHRASDDPWEVAELDAPWRRYTHLALPLASHYQGTRVDWWALDYKGKRPRRAAYGIGAAGLLLLGLAFWLWYGVAVSRLAVTGKLR
jgi:hypothetical protein